MGAKCKRCKNEMNSSEEPRWLTILSPYLLLKANGTESLRLKDLKKTRHDAWEDEEIRANYRERSGQALKNVEFG